MESAGYRRLLYSSAAVVFGVMAQAVARGWLARELTGSNTGLGGVMLAFGIAMLLATPWGGVAADRFAKRTVLLSAIALLVISSAAIGLAVELDVIHYWMLVLASAVQAVAFAMYLPARIAFIAEVVEAEAIGQAIVLSQTAQEAVRVIAPALAGVLIGLSWFGTGGVFLMAAGTSVLAGVVLIGIEPGAPRFASSRSPIAEMVDAFRYIRGRRELLLVAVMTIAVVVVAFPYLAFLPTMADERFDVGATGYGVMSGVAGLGAVIAGFVAPRRMWATHRPWATVAVSSGLLGAALIALAVSDVFWLALLALLFVGGTALVFQTTTQALMLALSDINYHGRMQSMVVLGFSGFGLAALPLGLLADAITLRVTMAAMGAVVSVITAWFVFQRQRLRHTSVGLDDV